MNGKNTVADKTTAYLTWEPCGQDIENLLIFSEQFREEGNKIAPVDDVLDCLSDLGIPDWCFDNESFDPMFDGDPEYVSSLVAAECLFDFLTGRGSVIGAMTVCLFREPVPQNLPPLTRRAIELVNEHRGYNEK